MEIRSAKVLVTGAAGFIGSHLVDALVRKGARVKALAHYNSRNELGLLEQLPSEILREVDRVAGDVTDLPQMRSLICGSDIVFHLAALTGIPYSYQAPHSYVQTNILGTLNVLQACVDGNVGRFVHTSTSETYGTALYTPIDEKHPLQGQSPYSASKIGADMLAQSYERCFRLPVATIRPFNSYGPRQSARAIVPTIISQILSGKREVHLGSLDPVRDFTFVRDTVNGFIAVAASDQCVGQVVNVGFGKGIAIRELARLIIEMMEADVQIVCDPGRVRPKQSEVMELICCRAKAAELADWKPEYSLREGLKESIAYISANLERYKTDVYNV